MSVIFTPRARSSRWKALWPLALLLAVSIIGGIWLWRAWPQVLMQSAVWQRSLNLELSRLLQAVAENPAAAGLSLLGFSLVYGVLHALGPGHGKIVITTWLATHPAKLKSSIGLTLAASLLQGLVAIALVVVVLALLWLRRRRRAAGGPGDRILVSIPGQLVAVRSGACLPRHAVCYAIRGGECRGYSAGGLRHPNAVGLRAGLLSSRSQ